MTKRITPKANQTAHLTTRCNNKGFLFDLENNFGAMASWINTLPLFYSVSIHHVLFMSNHIHMIVTPKQDNLGHAMGYFLTNVSKYLNHRHGTINHIFGGRYLPTHIKDEKHYINVIRYIYQNPLRANIVKKAQDYPYSSLGQYLGEKNSGLFIEPDFYTQSLFEQGWEGRQQWLNFINDEFSDTEAHVMRGSLSRSVYKMSRRQRDALAKERSSIVI